MASKLPSAPGYQRARGHGIVRWACLVAALLAIATLFLQQWLSLAQWVTLGNDYFVAALFIGVVASSTLAWACLLAIAGSGSSGHSNLANASHAWFASAAYLFGLLILQLFATGVAMVSQLSYTLHRP